jgi:hypothetical protein
MKRMPAALAALAAMAAPLLAGAATPCTQETLTVQGTPVTIGYCIAGRPRPTGAQELIVPVAATYAARGGTTFARSEDLHFLAGEGISRVIEHLDLAKLGLTGTLHLTLAYAHGVVRIEGALLTPGAITVK